MTELAASALEAFLAHVPTVNVFLLGVTAGMGMMFGIALWALR